MPVIPRLRLPGTDSHGDSWLCRATGSLTRSLHGATRTRTRNHDAAAATGTTVGASDSEAPSQPQANQPFVEWPRQYSDEQCVQVERGRLGVLCGLYHVRPSRGLRDGAARLLRLAAGAAGHLAQNVRALAGAVCGRGSANLGIR